MVTAVSYEVGVGEVAFLRRIRPEPMLDAGTAPIRELQDAAFENVVAYRDGLSRLVARALHGTVESEGSIFAARTTFKEYQFRPLVKYLRSGLKRILIADEVGLGKTIEAGYILVEELARAKLRRILILCPAGLKRKWHDELLSRFGVEFGVASGRNLEETLTSDRPIRAIASFDSLRGRIESLEPHELHPLDLLIIDEVHHMIGRGEDVLRRKLGLTLSGQSLRVIGLSVTPVQIDSHDLRRVLEVIMGQSIDSDKFERDSQLAGALNRVLIQAQSLGNKQHTLLAAIQSLGSLGLDEAAVVELTEIVGRFESGDVRERSRRIRALRSKLELLSPFADVLIRNRKRDVGELRTRRVVNHPVRLSNAFETGYQQGQRVTVSEESIYQEVDGLLKSSFTHVHRLQLSSCLHAMIDLLRHGMHGFSVWRRGRRLIGPVDLLDIEESDGPHRHIQRRRNPGRRKR